MAAGREETGNLKVSLEGLRENISCLNKKSPGRVLGNFEEG